jgi:hypothetical protein
VKTAEAIPAGTILKRMSQSRTNSLKRPIPEMSLRESKPSRLSVLPQEQDM